MSAPWLVSICAGRWQLGGMRAARAAGLRVFAVDGSADAPGLAEADLSAVADVRSPEAVVSAVVAAGIVPAGAITFVSEVGMAAAAAVRERFNLPGPRASLVKALTDKATQRAAWDKAGVPGPRWRLCRDAKEAAATAAEFKFPVVIKPSDSAGSRGVTKVEDPSLVASAFDRALAASPTRRALVESFLPGVEYTVETFACAGKTHVLAVTEKTKVPGTGGTVANELGAPTVRKEWTQAVGQAAVSALEALGYHEGPGHTEVMLSPEGSPFLVEAAGRGAGFAVFDRLVPKASGFDIADACARQAVGWPTAAPAPKGRCVVLRFFPSRPGRIAAIEGFEAARALPGVEAEAFVRVGDSVNAVSGDGDRLGYLLTEGDTPAAARAMADRAEALIRFTVEGNFAAKDH